MTSRERDRRDAEALRELSKLLRRQDWLELERGSEGYSVSDSEGFFWSGRSLRTAIRRAARALEKV